MKWGEREEEKENSIDLAISFKIKSRKPKLDFNR